MTTSTDPQSITCTGECTVHVVHELSFPLLNLGPEEGMRIAVAVAVVWAVGWCFRALIRTVLSMTETSNQTEERY